MNPETSPSIISAFKASMAVHPTLWTLGVVAVVGGIGYYAFYKKKPAAVEAKAAA